jgi:nucleoid-associated protein EbfC
MNINPFELLKNAQQLQEKLGDIQQKMKDITVTGSSGGGMVKIEINGQFDVLNVIIEPDTVDPSDVTMLQDLIKAAFSDAMTRVKEEMKSHMTALGGNLPIPPGFLGL